MHDGLQWPDYDLLLDNRNTIFGGVWGGVCDGDGGRACNGMAWDNAVASVAGLLKDAVLSALSLHASCDYPAALLKALSAVL